MGHTVTSKGPYSNLAEGYLTEDHTAGHWVTQRVSHGSPVGHIVDHRDFTAGFIATSQWVIQRSHSGHISGHTTSHTVTHTVCLTAGHIMGYTTCHIVSHRGPHRRCLNLFGPKIQLKSRA